MERTGHGDPSSTLDVYNIYIYVYDTRRAKSKRKTTHRLVVVLRMAVHDRHSVVHHHGGLLDLAAVHLRVRRRHGHGWRRQTGRRRVPVVHAAVAAHVTAGVHAGVRFAALRKVTGFKNTARRDCVRFRVFVFVGRPAEIPTPSRSPREGRPSMIVRTLDTRLALYAARAFK